jgi:alkylhydroperoxidase family enzyme
MARLEPVPDASLTLGTRFWFWIIRRVFGRMLKPYPILAHAPRLVAGATLGNALFSTGKWEIGPELRTLIHLRVASLVGCVF